MKLAKKKNAIVVGCGTGTCILNNTKHIGGSSIGGGTIEGLKKRLIGNVSYEKFESMARKGHIEKVDCLGGHVFLILKP